MDWPKIDLFGSAKNKFKLPDLGKIIEDNVDLSNELNLTSSDLDFGSMFSLSDGEGAKDSINANNVPGGKTTDVAQPSFDIPIINSNVGSVSTPSSELTGMFDTSSIDIGDISGDAAGLDLSELGVPSLNDDLSNLTSDVDGIGDISEGLDTSDFSNIDISSQLNGMKLDDLDEIDMNSDELGLGFDPKEAFSGHGSSLKFTVESAFQTFGSTFTLDNIAKDITYRLTNRKFGSMMSMFRSMNSISTKVTGPLEIDLNKPNQNFTDILYETGAIGKNDMEGLDKLGNRKSDFTDMSHNYTHILGDKDTKEMSIDKIFSKTLVKSISNAAGDEYSDIDPYDAYKGMGMDNLTIVEDTKMMKEPVEDATSFALRGAAAGGITAITSWTAVKQDPDYLLENFVGKSGFDDNTISNYMKSDRSGKVESSGTDLDELLGTGIDLSGEGLSTDDLLSSSGIDISEFSSSANNIMSESQVEMPDTSGFNFDLNSIKVPQETESSSSITDKLSGLNTSGVNSGLTNMNDILGEFNTSGEDGHATKQDVLDEMERQGFTIDINTIESEKKKTTYDDFAKELSKIREEDLKNLYGEGID